MTQKELHASKIKAEKQWIWMLMNYEDEDLKLPYGQTRQEAIDISLDYLSY